MRGQRRGRGQRQRGRRRQRRGDYRIFVGAFPGGELAAALQALREEADPQTAAISPPHVTLAGPYWRSGPATEANETVIIHRLQQHGADVAPFDLILGGVRRFGNRAVYLGALPTDGLLEARQMVLDVLGPDKNRRYTPHLTLAMRISPDAMAALVERLAETKWEQERHTQRIEQLKLMQRGPDDHAWREIAEIALGGSAGS